MPPAQQATAEPRDNIQTTSVRRDRMRPGPLFPGQWRECRGSDLVLLQGRFNNLLRSVAGLSDSARAGGVRVCAAPFYGGVDVWEVDVREGRRHAGVLDVLSHPGGTLILNGSSPPIHGLNLEVALVLDTEEQARAYLHFFCNAVHGDEGSFATFENWSDLFLKPAVKGGAVAELTATVPDWPRLRMVRVDGEKPVAWRCDVSVAYGGALFRAEMEIHETGMVRMQGDKVIATDIPVRAARYRNGVRCLA